MIRLLVLVSLWVGWASEENERVLSNTHVLKGETTLKIVNQFGSVKVTEWENPDVFVRVVISTTSDYNGDVMQQLNKVQIDSKEVAGRISYFTRIDKNLKGEVKIDYEVKMPSSVKLDLSQSFGDLKLGELHAESKIVLSYGSIVSEGFHGKTLIDLSFSKGEISHLENGRLELSYSNIELEKASQMDLVSKFSEVYLKEVVDLQMSIKYGELKIEAVNTLNGDAHFTQLSIDWLKKSLLIDANYVSDFEVKKLDKQFSSFTFSGQFTPLYLKLEEGLSGTFDISLSQGELNNQNPNLKFNSSVKESGRSEFSGTIGTGESNHQIRIEGSNGNLRIR